MPRVAELRYAASLRHPLSHLEAMNTERHGFLRRAIVAGAMVVVLCSPLTSGEQAVLPPLSGAKPDGVQKEAAGCLRVGVIDSMVKVPQERARLEDPASIAKQIAWGEPIRIDLARNEFENAQIVMTSSTGEALRDVRLEIGKLALNENTAWSAGEIIPWRVDYVEMYDLWAPHNRLGWFPDPLTPLSGPLTIEAGRNQTALISFHATRDMPVGLYRGSVTVRAAGVSPVTLPIEVRVWDFAVPVEQHFTLSIPIWGDHMETMYGKPLTPAQRQAYLAMLLDHRVAPFPLSVEEQTFCFDRGMRDFNLVCYPNNGVPADARKIVEAPFQEWKHQAWSSQAKSYVLLGDESRPEAYAFIREQGRIVHDVSPEIVRRFTLTPENTHKGFDYAIEQLRDAGDTVILGTARCFPVVDMTRMARQAGLNVWWYYVAEHYYIPTEGLEGRQVFWRHWKYQIPGELHWGMNYWGDTNVAGKDGKKWPEVPWDTKDCRGGDGYLTYPAAGGGRYLPSQRLELLRDGVEDYEYFWLLNDLTEKLSQRKDEAATKRAAENRRLLDLPVDLVKSYKEYSEDPQAYREYRKKLADAIVKTQALLRG